MKCSRTTAKGNPCKGNAIPGTDPPVCASHCRPVGRRTELFEPEDVPDGKGGTTRVTLADRILGFLATGAQVTTVLAALGVPSSTYYDWIKRGEAGDGDEYIDFAQKVARAQAEGELTNVATIKRAAAKDWRAAAWLLTKNNPGVYGGSGRKADDGAIDPDPAYKDPGEDPFSELERAAGIVTPIGAARGRRRAAG